MIDIRSRILNAHSELLAVNTPREYSEAVNFAANRLISIILDCDDPAWEIVDSSDHPLGRTRPKPGQEEIARVQMEQVQNCFSKGEEGILRVLNSPQDYEPIVVALAAVRSAIMLHKMEARLDVRTYPYKQFTDKVVALVMGAD